MRVLLVEPSHKNKYPPLGLMKISSFHKEMGDEVYFVKGLKKEFRGQIWDRIYVSTLFSFYWNATIQTIKYYEFSVKEPRDFYIGGPMATIMADEIEKETGFRVVKGLLNKKGTLNLAGDHLVDSMVPDYSILEQIEYKYPANNAYFGYMTRGCIRKCKFCAVHRIEPVFKNYIPLRKQVDSIKEKFGEKKDLLLLDNNVLASSKFDRIIDEIKEMGFVNGAKLNKCNRHVDFNQGIDLRRLTKEKMKRLSEIPIRPLRIAFDHIKLKDEYIKRIEWAAEFGLKYLSNYILFNFADKPEDLYERLRINVDLNERLGTQIFSFPMKYIPINNKNRKYYGPNWNRRYVRSIQCILNATHGVVGPKKKFFEAAFGKNLREFKKLLLMPDEYIIYREEHKLNGASEWESIYYSLESYEKKEFHKIITNNDINLFSLSKSGKINSLLAHYYNSIPKHTGN